MKKYKDQTFLEYNIKIRRVREVQGNKTYKNYSDIFYSVEIEGIGEPDYSFRVPIKKDFRSALRKVFREIQKSL